MSWCPKCGAEYVEGFFKCSDCDCELVDALVQSNTEDYDEEKFLMTVNDSMEAELICGFLKENNIPALLKHRESGAYLELYCNLTFFGIDIYVPSRLWAEAKELIQIQANSNFIDDNKLNDIAEVDYRERISKKRKISMWIILLFFIPGILPILVGLFLTINYFLRSH
jgi:hypothetical protein